MLSRRDLMKLVEKENALNRTEILFNHLVSIRESTGRATNEDRVQIRRFASRFTSDLHSLLARCRRNWVELKRRFKRWLDVVPAYPTFQEDSRHSFDPNSAGSSAPGSCDHFHASQLHDGGDVPNLEAAYPETASILEEPGVLTSSSDVHCIAEAAPVVPNLEADYPENASILEEPGDLTSSSDVHSVAEDAPVVVLRRGRPEKAFEVCSERSKLRRTEDLRLHTPDDHLFFATSKVFQAQGFLGASRAFDQIRENPEAYDACIDQHSREKPLTPEEALGLFVQTGLSTRNYQILRNAATSHNSLLFPPQTDISEAKVSCYPPAMEFTEVSAEVPLQSLLDHTTSRIALLVTEKLDCLPTPIISLKLVSKYGMDGSGGHSLYKQGYVDDSLEVGNDGSIFLSCTVPLRLSTDTDDIWRNPTSNSTTFCRPVGFKFQKESKESVLETDANFERQNSELTPTRIVTKSGRVFLVTHVVRKSMVDGKVANILFDSGSRTCYVCGATPTQMNDIDEVLARKFPTTRLALGISSLHAKLRIFDAMLNLAYKQDVQTYTVTKGSCESEVVLARKLMIQERFKKEMKLLVDFPLPGGRGSSTDGNTVRKFFKNVSLGAEILGLDSNFLHRLSVLLANLSSSVEIDPEAFEAYAIETARMYVELYGWYPMTPTLHKVLIHGGAFLRESACPIGEMSEEALESLNKILRSYRQDFTRKTSRTDTNEDLMKRLMIWSDPVISTLRLKNPNKDVHPDIFLAKKT